MAFARPRRCTAASGGGLQRVIKTVDTARLTERLLENMREEIQAEPGPRSARTLAGGLFHRLAELASREFRGRYWCDLVVVLKQRLQVFRTTSEESRVFRQACVAPTSSFDLALINS